MGLIKTPTIRIATREDIRAIAAPIWALLSNRAPGADFDICLAGALSVTANLAYCAVGEMERKDVTRATLVPCELYQRLIASAPVDLEEALASRDLPGAAVLRTEHFVAVVMSASDVILVGIRGTQLAYDWPLNLWAAKRKLDDGLYFHRGFYLEAEKLALLLRDELAARYAGAADEGRPAPTLYLAGHSLGGAIAAILNRDTSMPRPAGCYVFGAPRSSNDPYLGTVRSLWAVRRQGDIVPHAPPAFLNYADYDNQRASDGNPYRGGSGEMRLFLSWVNGLRLKSFLTGHAMERYVSEVIARARQVPSVAQIWNGAPWLRDSWPFP